MPLGAMQGAISQAPQEQVGGSAPEPRRQHLPGTVSLQHPLLTMFSIVPGVKGDLFQGPAPSVPEQGKEGFRAERQNMDD